MPPNTLSHRDQRAVLKVCLLKAHVYASAFLRWVLKRFPNFSFEAGFYEAIVFG